MVGVCYFAVFTFFLCYTNSIKNKECPEICSCLGSYVDCASKKLESVPVNLPNWGTHLFLHNNLIGLVDQNTWKNLTALEELKLNKNSITVLQKDCFAPLKDLLILELNRNEITTIKGLTFQSLTHLTTLKLKKNRISQLFDGAFYGLQNMDKLILDNNYIKTISKGWLYGLDKLRELSISHNHINRIEIGAWEFCCHLIDLDISFNKLDTLDVETFKNLENLEKLNLNNNNISFIGENTFASLKNLKILHLNNNKISWTVEDANGGIFQSLTKLVKFHLMGNDIKAINRNGLLGLESVVQINLLNNTISTIQENAFEPMTNLKDLLMNTSSLVCDSNLCWFSVWLTEHNFDVKTVCAFPPELKGQALQKIHINNLSLNNLTKPRILQDLESKIMSVKGENVSLKCVAYSTPDAPMSFQWKKDNMDMPQETFTVENNSIDGKFVNTTSELNLFGVRDTDAGKYQCIIKNDYGTTYSQKASISVLIYPTFIKKPSNVTVHTGETAKLECSAHGEPIPEIAWHKDGGNDFPAAHERRMHVMPTDDVFFIRDVKPSDMGIYSCTAQNMAGVITANATLTVEEEPFFVHAMENKEITAGESAVLKCMAAGTPKPSICWLKDGSIIATTERHFIIAEDQLMVIVDTVEGDSGDYQCLLNNSLGEKTATCHLTVKANTLNPLDMLGILIIAVVCCAVITSLVWVVIIYQTRFRMQSLAALESATAVVSTHFPDDASDMSSCKDSGNGDSAKRSNEDLAPDEFGLVIARPDTQTPLLQYPRLTNHDRLDHSNSDLPVTHSDSD